MIIWLKIIAGVLLIGLMGYALYEQYEYWRFRKICKKLVDEGKMHDAEYDNLADDDSDGDDTCEGCGRGPADWGHCPMCCGSSYSCGSEECDFCPHEAECAEDTIKFGKPNIEHCEPTKPWPTK